MGAGTLEKNWIGPYEIIEVFSIGTMKLKNCLIEKILKTVQHASNLKPYLLRMINKRTTLV
jgi:hypothetical protein